MNFYPAYKYEDVLDLEAETFFHLCNSMEKVLAIKKITDLEVAVFPQLKEHKMKEIHRKAYRKAEPDDHGEKNAIKLGDLSKVLR